MLRFIVAATMLALGTVQANEIWTVNYEGSSTFYYDPQECLNCAPVTTSWNPTLTFETPTSADGVYIGAFGLNSVGNTLISISLSHNGRPWGFSSFSDIGHLVITITNGEVQAVNCGSGTSNNSADSWRLATTSEGSSIPSRSARSRPAPATRVPSSP